jgi:alpha-D-xyloside xylohydrolase
VQHPGEPVDTIELRIYGGRDSHFEFYDDEGDNYNYEQGAFEIIPMTWNDDQSLLTLGDRAGSYPTMPATRGFVLRAGELGDDRLDGHTPGVGQTVEYDGRGVTVRLEARTSA